jgi:hypothetical protein
VFFCRTNWYDQRVRVSCWLVLSCLTLSGVAAARPPGLAGDFQRVELVDWHRQVVHAVGRGAPDVLAQNPSQARQAAEKVALENAKKKLREIVEELPVDGSRRLKQLTQGTADASRLTAALGRAVVSGKRYFSDHGVEIELELSFAAMNELLGLGEGAEEKSVSTPTPSDTGNDFTGLLIDATSAAFRPVLLPEVVDDQGRVLFSMKQLNHSSQQSTAPACFVTSREQLKNLPKLGDRPLTVKAVKTSLTGVTLSKSDAQKVSELSPAVFADGHVVFKVSAKRK